MNLTDASSRDFFEKLSSYLSGLNEGRWRKFAPGFKVSGKVDMMNYGAFQTWITPGDLVQTLSNTSQVH